MYLFISGCLIVTLFGCAAGQAFNAGQNLEAQGKYEEAMLSYADAFRADPRPLNTGHGFSPPVTGRQTFAIRRVWRNSEAVIIRPH